MKKFKNKRRISIIKLKIRFFLANIFLFSKKNWKILVFFLRFRTDKQLSYQHQRGSPPSLVLFLFLQQVHLQIQYRTDLHLFQLALIVPPCFFTNLLIFISDNKCYSWTKFRTGSACWRIMIRQAHHDIYIFQTTKIPSFWNSGLCSAD